MCGIAGKLSFQVKLNTKEELPLIRKTNEILHHRGPDDEGYFMDMNIWLASTRLSIVDLSPAGHQPMINSAGNIFLVLNGEIYNYLELRDKLKGKYRFKSKSDTEVLLHLYEEYGIKSLQYLRGMFAFAIWDKQKQELFVARDRIGKKPVKYFYNDKFFIFASELKAFINHPGVLREIDWQAINEFLTFQYIPTPDTGFKNIYKLPPAHYLIVKPNGRIKINKYWDLDFSNKLKLSEVEWMEKIEDKLKESVKLRLQSDVPIGIQLSGGIDSGLVTAFSSLESRKPVNSVSIGFDKNDYNELRFAKLVSDKYHTCHHEIIIKPQLIKLLPQLIYHLEEPFADPSIIPTWFLMKESKKYFTVALNGDGGDENLAGYRRYQVMKFYQLIKSIPFKKQVSTLFSNMYQITHQRDFFHLARIFELDDTNISVFYREIMSFIRVNLKKQLVTGSFTAREAKYRQNMVLKQEELLDNLMYSDIKSYLPGILLAKADLLSMANSLEVRSPFLDHEFMELTAKIPSKLKLKGFVSKYILKKIAEKYLPERCIYRKKQSFIPPLANWFRGELKDYLIDQLFNPGFLNRSLVDKKALHDLYNEHVFYRADHAYALWTILCLKLWLDEWFPDG